MVSAGDSHTAALAESQSKYRLKAMADSVGKTTEIHTEGESFNKAQEATQPRSPLDIRAPFNLYWEDHLGIRIHGS
jgi:hypothetical protein